MGAGILPGKKQDFGLTQSTMLAVECPLRAKSGRTGNHYAYITRHMHTTTISKLLKREATGFQGNFVQASV